MATSKSIPSKVNSSTGATNASPSTGNPYRVRYLNITALLKTDTLSITVGGDVIDCGSPGPVSFSSPIRCDSFTANAIGQVAYYEA